MYTVDEFIASGEVNYWDDGISRNPECFEEDDRENEYPEEYCEEGPTLEDMAFGMIFMDVLLGCP